MPLLNGILFENEYGPAVDDAIVAAYQGALPGKLRYYTKKGDMYLGKRKYSMTPFSPEGWVWYIGMVFLLPLIPIILGKLKGPEAYVTVLLGAALCLGSAARVSRLNFDVEKGMMLLVSGFGLRVKRIRVNGYVRMQTVRSYGNFYYLGTTLYLYFTDGTRGEGKYTLGRGFFTRRLSRLEHETALLITAAGENFKRLSGKSE